MKVEKIPCPNLLPSSSRLDDEIGAGPMDISDDGTDAYSKDLLRGVVDIDAEDAGNPQLVSLYVNPIYSYMWQLEVRVIFFYLI